MCTILTVNQPFFFEHKSSLLSRIMADSTMNSEGWSLIGIDSEIPENDFRFNAMRVNQIEGMIDRFFSMSSRQARIFLHARAATTRSVGIAYTHGFDNGKGTLIMHNGVIRNTRLLSVDSFNLVDLSDDPMELLDQLKAAGELFANIFLINPAELSYGLVRLMTGTLFKDGKGNYSTNPMATIAMPVEQFSWDYHSLDDYAGERQSILDFYDRRYERSIKDELELEAADQGNERLDGWDSQPTKKRSWRFIY